MISINSNKYEVNKFLSNSHNFKRYSNDKDNKLSSTVTKPKSGLENNHTSGEAKILKVIRLMIKEVLFMH